MGSWSPDKIKGRWMAMIHYKRVLACALAGLTLLAGGCSTGSNNKTSNSPNESSSSTEEQWFEGSETEEDFDFGLDEEWLDLNNLEYTITDKLKCYLFIGTDHSGNETATDETYKGSMADFLLLLIVNKTDHTYGFIQLNRDTITDVLILDSDGEAIGNSNEQICTAHWYGGSRQQSCLNTIEAVSELLGGLNIDGYYSVGMDEIAKLNHVIGGVTVKIEDDFSKVDPTLVEGETLTLTDEQAHTYLSSTMDIGEENNESRMRRQRTYMEAASDQVKERIKAEKNFIEDITDTLGESVTTNMNGDDFGEIRDAIKAGEDLGIQVPEGESVIGAKLDDGLEHAEFYVDEADLAEIMTKLCDLQIDEFSEWDDLETESEDW